MDRLKKLTALLLSLSVILISAAGVFAAENFDDDGNRDEENGLSDEEQGVVIEDTHPQHELDNPEDVYTEDLEYDEYIRGRNEYNETVKKLTGFDMWIPISDSTYLDTIKAGEYFLSICRYLNADSFYDENASEEEMWRTAYETLRGLGYVDFIINYTGNISFDQALRTLVNALGYKRFADMRGGTADAYIQTASEHKITKSFPSDRNAAMTVVEAAALIEDSTKASAYIYNTNDDYEYIDVLEYYKDIYEITGIVEAVSDNSISSGSVIKNGIRIGNTLLASDRKDLYEYLACKTEAYYRKDDSGDRTLVYITYHSTNRIMTIEGYDIDSYENNRISYYQDGNVKKKAVISSKAKEVLNGFSPKPVTAEDFENCDYVKLVDNDNDGQYDVVFIYKYDIMVVKRVSESNDIIYGLYNDIENSSLKVDFDSNNLDMTDRMGNPVEAYYITEDSVLSVAKDIETGKMKIIVSNLMYTGTVRSTKSADTYYDSTVNFEDRTYTYSTNFKYYKGSKAIRNNNKYTVYLDYRGRIAGYDLEKEDELKYGFLIRAWLDNDTDDESAVVKMFPYSGEMENFTIKRKAKIDGEVCNSASGMIACLRTAAGYQDATLKSIDSSYVSMDYYNDNIVYIRVPVMYKQNDDGEITYIDTPYHGESENPEKNDVFHDNTMTMYKDFSNRTDSARPGGMYLRNTLAFNNDNSNNVAVNSATKVFVAPVSNDTSDISDEDQYIKTDLTYFSDWNYYPKTGAQYTIANRLEAYNVDESRTAGVIVYYTSDVAPEIDKKVPLTVVDKVIDAVDDEGNNVKRVIGWQGNAEIQVDLANGVYLTRYYNGSDGSKITSEVKHGDIIRYVTNNAGKLVDYVKVFSLTDEDDPDYVKTGNEYGTNVDPSTLNKTLLAVSDGKYAGNGHNTPHVYDALGSYSYGASYRLVYGTIMYKNGTNLVLKTKVDSALGQLEKIEIADFSGYNVLCIDERSEKIYVPNEDELLAEQGAGDAASKVILHTEGGKQRQLIIIKRTE